MKVFTRIIGVILAVAMVFNSVCVFPARAEGLSDWAAFLNYIEEGLREAYEGSVISRMSGRAGAATKTGAKGIVFEVMYADKANIKNAASGLKTSMSTSSIDTVADLVTVNEKTNEVVQYIQCKNATSDTGIRNIINQIKNGQYADAELVATKESAKLLQQAAHEAGLDVEIIDSGISENVTMRIANKGLGNVSAGQVLSASAKSAGIAAIIAGSVSVIESVYNGCTPEETAGAAFAESIKASLAVGIGTAAGEVAGAGLAAAGVSGFALSALPFIIVIGTSVAVGYALDKMDDRFELKEYAISAAYSIGDGAKRAGSAIKETAVSLAEDVKGWHLQEKTIRAKDSLVEKVSRISLFQKE